MRKPRSDARLKTLPPERQAEIARYCINHSLKEGIAWLAAGGFKTSSGALSEFLAWWSAPNAKRHPYAMSKGRITFSTPCSFSAAELAIILADLIRSL